MERQTAKLRKALQQVEERLKANRDAAQATAEAVHSMCCVLLRIRCSSNSILHILPMDESM